MSNTKYGTISAGQTVTVVLDGNVRELEIINRTGTGEMWIEVDPTTGGNLTPGDDGLDLLPAAVSFVVLPSRSNESPTSVKIHSITEQNYAVRGM